MPQYNNSNCKNLGYIKMFKKIMKAILALQIGATTF